MKPPKQFQVSTAKLASMKRVAELFAKEDGIQRGAFFDTVGKLHVERVSSTSTHTWLFKTDLGQPFTWKGQDDEQSGKN